MIVPTGPTGDTGPGSGISIETNYIGDIDTLVSYNEGSGNNQALGALVFNPSTDRTVTMMSAYILQQGNGSGIFQMAILQPTGNNSADVIGITNQAASITTGLFALPLTAPVTLMANSIYYLAVYNQVIASQIGGSLEGTPSAVDAPPINFRVQNLSGFTVGDTINTSDVSLTLSPWLAAYN